MNIQPAVRNLTIQRGDTFELVFNITIDGEVLDLSTSAVYAEIRTSIEQSSALVETFTVTVDAESNITLALTHEETALVATGEYYYDVLVVSDTNDRTHYLKGRARFVGTVTAEPEGD